MAALDMGTLGGYVKMADHLEYQAIAQGTVSVLVTHSNLEQQWPEIRVDLHTTIGALKDRLYTHGGTGGGYQRLILKDSNKEVLRELSDDDKMLGFYGVQSGMEIHIIDTDPYSFSKDGGLENVDLVKKYVMDDDDYGKLPGSLRNYKLKQREKDPYWTFLKENRREPKNKNPPTKQDVEGYEVGMRCEVQPGSRRGVVKWVGEGEDSGIGNGYWIGVALDEPLGKNDGKVKGKKYFECLPKHGTFVRPDKAKLGDFPELDFDDSDDSDEEL